MKYWTIPELKLAMEMWREGKTKVQIAEALGRGTGSVHDQIERNRAMFPMRRELEVKGDPLMNLNVKIPRSMHNKTKKASKDNGQSISQFVREAITEKLKR